MKIKNFSLPFDIFCAVQEPDEVKPALEKFQKGKFPSLEVANLLEYLAVSGLQVGKDTPEANMRFLAETQTLNITPPLQIIAKAELLNKLDKGFLNFRGSGYWGLEFSTSSFRWYYLSAPLNGFVLYNLYLIESWDNDPPYPLTLEQCRELIDNRFELINKG